MGEKYYLIDTENVGDRWMEFIPQLQEEEQLVVFYTQNHSKLLEETFLKQRYNKQIHWIECFVGSNALDYQLMGVLSYLVANSPGASYTIYSNDKDYQNVIDFWSQRNVFVEAAGFEIASTKNKKKKKKKKQKQQEITAEQFQQQENEKDRKQGEEQGEEPVSFSLESDRKGKEDSEFLETESTKASGEGSDLVLSECSPQEIVVEIAKAVPVSHLGIWYAVLVSLLGQEAGREEYGKLKQDKEYREELSVHLFSDVRKRKLHLISALFQSYHLDADKAEAAYDIVERHNKKNKKAIKEDFEKYFGKKTAQQTKYYKVIKPIIDLLKES